MTGLRRKIVSLACVLLLPACESLFGPSSYPDLRSVGSPGDTSSALEERRQIVRDLIENRDLARYRQSVVRHRSGLEDTPPPTAPAATALRAEDIIRQAPIKDDKTLDEALVGDGESDGDSLYRDRAQFEDGTLNDFIRQLKRDTDPVVIEEPSADEPAADFPSTEEDSIQEETGELEPQAWRLAPASEPAILLAFAPVVRHGGGPALLRLAADEDQPGFFCSYLGWMVAWSTACLPEDVSPSGGGEAVQSPDVEDESVGERNAPAQAEDQTAEPPEPQVSRRTEQARRSIGDEGARPSEDVDDNELLPVSSMLERLRNLIRSRGRPSDQAPEEETSLAYEAETLRPDPDQGPPLPISRPDVERDLRIVRHDEVFEFTRTQRPAFKPAPPEPKTVIFPREGQAGRGARKEPERAPEPSSVAPKEQKTAAVATDRRPSAGDDPATRIPGALKDPDVLDKEVILFEPNSVRLPKGVETRLEEMLEKAKAMDAKLFIVSEAAIGRLAQDRARAVGLALVRMDATADLIEYDIVIDRRSDRVQVLLKPDSDADPPSAAAGGTGAGN